MLLFNVTILCVPQYADRGVSTYTRHSLHRTNLTCNGKQRVAG